MGPPTTARATASSRPPSNAAPPPAPGAPNRGGHVIIAATPATIHQLRKLGVEVLVQSGAGEGASILDAEYAEAGAHLVPTAAALHEAAELVIKVRAPMALPEDHSLPRPLGSGRAATHEVELLKEGGRLISFIWPAQNPDLLELLAGRKATVLAMDMVPWKRDPQTGVVTIATPPTRPTSASLGSALLPSA